MPFFKDFIRNFKEGFNEGFNEKNKKIRDIETDKDIEDFLNSPMNYDFKKEAGDIEYPASLVGEYNVTEEDEDAIVKSLNIKEDANDDDDPFNAEIPLKDRKYVSLNSRFLFVLKKYQIDLKNHDWRKFFSIAWLDGLWEDGTYSLGFPLYEKFVECGDKNKESAFLEELRSKQPSFWHVPKEAIEPIENMKDANILLNL